MSTFESIKLDADMDCQRSLESCESQLREIETIGEKASELVGEFMMKVEQLKSQCEEGSALYEQLDQLECVVHDEHFDKWVQKDKDLLEEELALLS